MKARGWRWAAAAFAFALAASACSTGHSASSPTASTGQPSTANSTGPSYQWSQVASLPTLGGGAASTIAGLLPPAGPGETWLAAGSTTSATGQVTATSWTSSDALTWTSSPAGPAGADSQIRAVAQWNSRQLAVGTVGSGASQRAAVWLSAGAGRPLVPVKNEAAFVAPSLAPGSAADGADAGAQMNEVATGALGIFAAGTINGQQAIWYSSGGSHWTLLSGAQQAIDSANQPQINDLLVAANGVWAVGSVHNGTQTNAAVWTSTDGIHWYRVESAQNTFAADGDRVINSIAALGTGFVAVGGVRTGSQWLPASWISPDGVSWSSASESFPESPSASADTTGTTANAVADDPGVGLVAVGGSPSAQRVWTSTDGQSWTEIPLPATAASATGWHLGLVAALGTTTVIADNTVGAPRLLVDTNGTWKEVTSDPSNFGVPAAAVTPASLISDNGIFYLAVNIRTPGQALGSGTSSAAILSSTDGTTWRVDAQGGPFAGHQIDALLAVQSGLLAAGSTAAGSGPAAALWSSADGLSWSPVPMPAAPAATVSTLSALARIGASVVALGQEGAAPGSPPGQPLAASAASWIEQGGLWQARGTLDTLPSVATETVSGACTGPQSAVAVGAAAGASTGTVGTAWSSDDGVSWQAASVSPTPSSGAAEEMVGCLSTGNGYLAYGASPGTTATTDPALWQSTDGSVWTRQNIAAFNGNGGGPIDDLALHGTTWLAASGAEAPGAASTLPTAATASCDIRLWSSTDGGATWQALDTTGAPWTASLYAAANLVGFVGGNPVVVGTTNGQLAVWEGQPAGD